MKIERKGDTLLIQTDRKKVLRMMLFSLLLYWGLNVYFIITFLQTGPAPPVTSTIVLCVVMSLLVIIATVSRYSRYKNDVNHTIEFKDGHLFIDGADHGEKQRIQVAIYYFIPIRATPKFLYRFFKIAAYRKKNDAGSKC